MSHCLHKRSVMVIVMTLCTAISPWTSAQQTTPTTQNQEASALEVTHAQSEGIRVSPQRNFGYVIGDVLTQRIVLPGSYSEADFLELTDINRVSTWLERQAALMETLADGRQTLTLRYQVINAPQSIISVALPELALASSSGDSMTVPAWPFTLGPLTASVPQADSATADSTIPVVDGIALKNDLTLPRLDDITPAARLRLALLFLGLALASWAGWYFWRNHRDKVRLPFAQALQSLGSRQQRKHGNTSAPWKTLHHAFNHSAGRVVNTSSIDALLETHDWLRPLEPRIRAFYAASAARHYALPPRDESFAVEELARVLADCERRNSR